MIYDSERKMHSATRNSDWVLLLDQGTNCNDGILKHCTIMVDQGGCIMTISTRLCLDQDRWKTAVMPSFESDTQNQHNSSLPTVVYDYSTAQVLDLHKSRYILELHPSIGIELPNLRYLILTRCDQLQRVPESICALQLLQELDFTDSPLIEELPENIGKLKCLKRLIFGGGTGHHNKVLTSLPDSIGDMENLEELVLDKCKALQSLPTTIGQLSKLTFLSMKECKAITTIPESIGLCNNLVELSFLKCINMVRLPNSIGNLKNLEDLNLGKCTTLESLPDGICDLQQLAFLNLSGCSNLKALPSRMDQLSTLYRFDCKGCEGLTNEDVTKLQDVLPNLKELEFP